MLPPTRTRRRAKTLVLFVLLLPALLGMVGLVVDTGLMMAAQRRAQNAADAAATAAAMHLYRGDTGDMAVSAANTFIKTYNGLSNAPTLVLNAGAENAVNIPPTQGPYATASNNNQFVEVHLTYPVTTLFMGALGISSGQSLRVRAVAGYQALANGEGAIVLDPEARPGLSIQGGAVLRVDGAVIVNSRAAGLDQYGANVDWGLQQYALSCSNNSTIEARLIQVRGGVDVVANYHSYDPDGPPPLFCRAPISPDPLRNLPSPTQANVSSITNWMRQSKITISNGQTYTFNPGVYEDIEIKAGATVTFNPGVYIFSPDGPQQGLKITGDPTVTGNGVMFYLTGTSYLDTSPGYYDALDDTTNDQLDGLLPPTPAPNYGSAPDSGTVRYATLTINATNATINLTGLQDASSPYNGILFFQRRRNTSAAAIQGNAGANVNLGGTIYAKWARFKIEGGGRYDAQFVVGSMDVAGQATVTINAGGKSFGRANQVFLVE